MSVDAVVGAAVKRSRRGAAGHQSGGGVMRIGSLFSGYGGLDMAVAAHYDATVAWHVEFDKAPSKVLAHHWPDVPNHGDVTAVDWSQVEPVDIITGGFPCQDVSHAGLRAGVHQGTRSGLWFQMARAIDALQPRKAIIENVAGLLSADAACNVEPCPWCVGDEPAGHMRALGAVLADLAEMGFDAEWGSVRAADAGAPHGRLRVFIVATARPAESRRERGIGRPDEPQDVHAARRPSGAPAADAGSGQLPRAAVGVDGLPVAGERGGDPDLTLLPTPKASDGPNGGPGMRNGRGVVGQLLPTPRAARGASATETTEALLPTPQAHDARGPKTPEQIATMRDRGAGVRNLNETAAHEDFGPYTAAITRWSAVLGRQAPPPTEPANSGRPRLSPRFVEFLMGLPDGWVVDIPGVTRTAALKMLGNGVVPQQALLALSLLDPS